MCFFFKTFFIKKYNSHIDSNWKRSQSGQISVHIKKKTQSTSASSSSIFKLEDIRFCRYKGKLTLRRGTWGKGRVRNV